MDRPPPEHGQQFGAEARAVTVDYFQSIGISLVRGRPFSRADDSASASVIVINQTLADQLFPGEDPLGKFIEVQLDEPHQVVGVVTDAHQFGVASAVRPEIYAPHAQLFVSWIRRSMDLVVHTDVDPESVVSSVREAIWAIDASVPIANVKTMERWVAEDVSGPRFRTVLLSTFSVVALILAVVGIAGVLSYAVTRRTPEFGLRAALGASKSDVFGLVFRQGGTLTLLGCTLGAALSLLSSRFLQSLLFDMNGFDTVTMTTVLGVVVLVSMLSMSIPAIRAGRISPMVAMREG